MSDTPEGKRKKTTVKPKAELLLMPARPKRLPNDRDALVQLAGTLDKIANILRKIASEGGR